MEVIHMNSDEQSEPNEEVQGDVQDIVAFGQRRRWHVLVIAGEGEEPSKGLIIAQPGKPSGILRVLVDMEGQGAA